jgi:hypothetical protein
MVRPRLAERKEVNQEPEVTKQKRLGRPKLPSDEHRDVITPTRLKYVEDLKFQRICDKRGIGKSAYIREYILSEIARLEKSDPELFSNLKPKPKKS